MSPSAGHTSIDNGWAWIVLIGSFYIAMFLPTITIVFGLQIGPLTKQLNMSEMEVSLLFNTFNILFNSMLFFTGPLCETFGFRKVCMSSSLVAAFSYALLYRANSTLFLIIVFGVITGTSAGITTQSVFCVIPQFFEKKRGFALSSYFSATAIGCIIIPHLVKHLMDEYGLSGSIIIYGGLILNSCVSGALFRPSPRSVRVVSAITKEEKSSHELDHLNIGRETLQSDTITVTHDNNPPQDVNAMVLVTRKLKNGIKALRSYRAILICVGISSFIVGYIHFVMLVPYYLAELGYSAEISAWTISFCFMSNFVTRIVISITVDYRWFPARKMFIAGVISGGVFCILFSQVTNLTWKYLMAGGSGVGIAFGVTLFITVIIDVVGMDSYTPVMSAFGLVLGLMFLLAIPIYGSLRSVSGGTHASTVVFSGALQVAAGVIWILLSFIERIKK